MKKIVLLFVLLNSYLSFSQLSETSQLFKDNEDFFGDIYQNIRSSAIERWGDNDVMIVSQINLNTEACYELIQQYNNEMGLDELIIFRGAIEKWVDYRDKLKYESAAKTGSGIQAFRCCRYNWIMLQSEVEQQIKASKSY
jgi:hypothetical protein